MKLYVTYCCRDKIQQAAIPEEMYRSPRVKSFFKRFTGRKGILSYKYGLMFPFVSYEPYDLDHFENFEGVVRRSKELVRLFNVTEFVFYSPRKLVEKPWLRLLQAIGIPFKIIRSYKEV